MSSEILYSTGLPVLDVPPLIHRDLGAHLGSTSIAAVDYIAACENCSGTASMTSTANTHNLFANPFVAPWFGCQVDRLAIDVVTGQAGTEVFLGVFENSDAQDPHNPGDLFSPGKTLYRSGSLATTASGLVTTTVSGAVLKPGRLYWAVAAFTAAATMPTVRALQTGARWLNMLDASSSGTFGAGLTASSSTVPVNWSDAPQIPGVAWLLLNNIPVIRYRLAA